MLIEFSKATKTRGMDVDRRPRFYGARVGKIEDIPGKKSEIEMEAPPLFVARTLLPVRAGPYNKNSDEKVGPAKNC
jgi:hypothetical protein